MWEQFPWKRLSFLKDFSHRRGSRLSIRENFSPVKNLQFLTKIYLYPWDERSCLKSICQTLSSPLGNLKCLGLVQTAFLCCTLDKWGRHFFWPYEHFPNNIDSWMLLFCQWTNGLTHIQSLGVGILVSGKTA